MALTLEQFLEEHPVDRDVVNAYKGRMISEVRAYKLRELREASGLTQQQVADRIGVSQRQISKLERGDIENSRVRTIRAFLNAVGGDLALEFIVGDARIQVA